MSFLQTNRYIIISCIAQPPFSPLMTGRRLRQTDLQYMKETVHSDSFFFNILIPNETHLYPLNFCQYILVLYIGRLLWSCSGNVCKTILSTV